MILIWIKDVHVILIWIMDLKNYRQNTDTDRKTHTGDNRQTEH